MGIRRGDLRSPAGEHSSPLPYFPKHPYENQPKASAFFASFASDHFFGAEVEVKFFFGQVAEADTGLAQRKAFVVRLMDNACALWTTRAAFS